MNSVFNTGSPTTGPWTSTGLQRKRWASEASSVFTGTPHLSWASQVAQVVKNPPANAGDAADGGSIPRVGKSSGGGNGNPLHYSCLGNPVDRGAWCASVHGVTNSRTWQSTHTQYLPSLTLPPELRKTSLGLPLILQYGEPYSYFIIHHKCNKNRNRVYSKCIWIILKPSPLPWLWKHCFWQNLSPVSKRLGTAAWT